MPQAAPFVNKVILGLGLPQFRSQQVNNLEYWTTLSGHNKDTGGVPTQESIDESLRKAFNFYWNLYSVKADMIYTGGGTSVSLPNSEQVLRNSYAGEPLQPKDRLCNLNRFWSYPNESRSGERIYVGVGGREIVALLDGEQLLGYALDNIPNSGGGAFDFLAGRLGGSVTTNVRIGGYIEFPPPINSLTYKQGYTSLDGYHFCAEVTTRTGNSSLVVSSDVESLTASAIFTSLSNPSNNESTSITVTGLEFYTYP